MLANPFLPPTWRGEKVKDWKERGTHTVTKWMWKIAKNRRNFTKKIPHALPSQHPRITTQ